MPGGPSRCDRAGGLVAGADRRPGRHHHHVAVGHRLPQHRFERGPVVGDDPVRARDPTRLGTSPARAEAVASRTCPTASSAASAGTTSSPVEQMPTTGRACTCDRGDPGSGEHAEVGRPQRPAGRDQQRADRDVLVGPHHPVTGRDRAHHLDRARHRLLGVLDHHDRVGAVGQRPAGGHAAAAVPARTATSGARAHGDRADDVEVGGQPLGGAVGVRRPHGEAVDRRAGEAGQRAAAPDVVDRHPAEGVVAARPAQAGAPGRPAARPAPRRPCGCGRTRGRACGASGLVSQLCGLRPGDGAAALQPEHARHRTERDLARGRRSRSCARVRSSSSSRSSRASSRPAPASALGEHLVRLVRPDPARHALAARLVAEEPQHVGGGREQVGALGQHHQRAGAEHRAGLGQRCRSPAARRGCPGRGSSTRHRRAARPPGRRRRRPHPPGRAARARWCPSARSRHRAWPRRRTPRRTSARPSRRRPGPATTARRARR